MAQIYVHLQSQKKLTIKMKKTILLVLFCSLVATTIHAQETVYFKKDDSNNSSRKKSKKKAGTSSEQNIIKVAPLNFIVGVIPFHYERAINETFSVQIGIGITSSNYIKDAIRSAQSDNNSDVSSTVWNGISIDPGLKNENNSSSYKNRKSSLGYYAALEPRIYFASEGLDGAFMGLSFSKTRYNSTSKKVATGPATSSTPSFTAGDFSGHETFTDVFVNFGTQTLYDRISLEYSFGLGLRKVTGTEYAFAQDYSGSGGSQFIDGVSTLDKTKLGFNLSLKVGYHF
jgi:hypothetical protein